MEDVQKALQIAFAVFLFIIAATTAVFLYRTSMITSQEILKINDNMDMSAEYVSYEGDKETTRTKSNISCEEVIMTILDIENNKSYINKIIVATNGGTYTYLPDDDSYNNLEKITGKYSYEYNNKTLKYTYMGT